MTEGKNTVEPTELIRNNIYISLEILYNNKKAERKEKLPLDEDTRTHLESFVFYVFYYCLFMFVAVLFC